MTLILEADIACAPHRFGRLILATSTPSNPTLQALTEGWLGDDMGKCILFLMDGWSSSAGGIQTVNRELILSLARTRTDITCIAIVTAASEAEIEHAYRSNVTLIRGETPNDWTSVLLSRDLQAINPSDVIAVVGHSYFSGAEARMTRDRFFAAALVAHFVHMDPMRVEGRKEDKKDRYIAEREAKLQREIEIARQADLVFCVGPRLHRYMRDQFASRGDNVERVLQINCGLSSEVQLDRVQPVEPTVLCLGRTESLGVKGLDIFGYTAGLLHVAWTTNPLTKNRPVRPKFVVRGAEKNAEALEATLQGFAREVGGNPTIVVRPYTTYPEDLASDLRGASAFLMPSREEGFGLVACEALSVGTPIIVSAESGVAELIQEVARETGQAFNACVVAIDGDAKATAQRFCEATLPLLAGDGADEGFYPRLMGHLLPICSWEAGARFFIETLERTGRAQSAGVSTPPVEGHFGKEQQAPPKGKGKSLSDLELMLSAERKSLLEIEGVLGVSLKHAIVVMIEQGSKPKLPAEVAGIQVVIREIAEIRLSSISKSRGHELIVDGQRRATVGLFGVNDEGGLFAITVAHAFPLENVPIAIRTDDGDVTVRIEAIDRDNDWALLRMPDGARSAGNRRLGHPDLGTAVKIELSDRIVGGTVNTIEMSAEILGSRDIKRLYNDLFEISAAGVMPLGCSGAVISSIDDEVLGILVASMIATAGNRTFLGRDVTSILDTYRLRPTTIGGSFAGPAIGLVITDDGSADAVLKRLVNVRRFTKGNRLYFRGTTDGGVPVICLILRNFGNMSAAIATTALLTENSIRAIFLVGLCDGLQANLRIGDVIVSSEIISYEFDVFDQNFNRLRPKVTGITPSQLVRLAAQVARESVGPIAVHVGRIASANGGARGSRGLKEMLATEHRLLAVDMESAGVAQAVATLDGDVPVVVVRGVAGLPGKVDHVDQIEISDHAAQVSLAIISRLMPPDSLDFENLVADALRREFAQFSIEIHKEFQDELGRKCRVDALMRSDRVDIIVEIKNPQRVSSLRQVIADAAAQLNKYKQAYVGTIGKLKWVETVVVVPEIGDVYIDTIPLGIDNILVFDRGKRTFLNSDRLHSRLKEGSRF